MFSSIEDYLGQLRKELSGSDRATVQDALSDAEEYLRTAVSSAPSGAGVTQAEALASVVEKYGTPAEIAAAYRQVESRTLPALAPAERGDPSAVPAPQPSALPDKRPFYARFFGVFAEPRAWGSLFYLLFTLATGIIYFTWAVTGLSVSLSFLVLIIGLPLAGLFLLSVKGIALVEGCLVEALLGGRMPRRQRFSEKKATLWQHFKSLVTDEHVWFSIIYMLLQMPLGIIYFTVFITLASVSLGIIFWPIVAVALGEPLIMTSTRQYFATGWLIPIAVVVGALLLTATMHLAKATGKAHGALAKTLLVRP